MKYTDLFFEFPVRIYDRFSVMRSYEKEKDLDIPDEGRYAPGWHKLPYSEITQWMDFFDSEKGVEGVEEEGFTETLVFTKEETFVCTLPRWEFEKLLNAHVDKIEKDI